MKRIIFHCSWGQSSSDLLDVYKIQTPKKSGIWNDIEATDDPALADFHIVMDGSSNGFGRLPQGVPLNKILFFQREEPEVIYPRLEWPDDLFFQGTYTDLRHHLISVWRVKTSYDDLLNLKYNKTHKTKLLSTITSGKVDLDGHKKRVHFLERFVDSYKNIDVYGQNGIETFGSISECWKGSLNYDGYCKFKGLYPYHYTLAFENSNNKNCVSEKIFDSLLSWTMPIYWGCPNVDEFLPENSYHVIDIDNVELAVQQILKIIETVPTIENINAMAEARDLILNRYNLWSEIDAIIDGCPVGGIL
tara:strand:- start:3820 stop:4731 length:912 start_codon:yes stop_codon:yes gene_type:complete